MSFFYLWGLVSFRYRKCLVVAFWRAREFTKETNYLRIFIIPIHIAFSADSSFNKLLFIKMRIVTNKVGCRSPGSAELRIWPPPRFFPATLRKTAVLLSHLQKVQKGATFTKVEVPWDSNKCICWLAIIRCQAVSKWEAPGAPTWSMSNCICAGFGITAQPASMRHEYQPGLFVIVSCCCLCEWLIYTRWNF